ncbi:MAG: hypothetical protein JWM68_1356 [Verrucomicrobiales bacterium]|nr:hypothetical protein [Verrucomicrobiales bacterium]
MHHGKLFIFEGPDGSGKTTLSRKFAEQLSALGHKCEWHAFPGREIGSLGKHVYDLHHQPSIAGVSKIDPVSLQLLHVAAHIDALHRWLIPAIISGKMVVLDRFWWSTLVYGLVNGADEPSLARMINLERLHWEKILPARAFLVRRECGKPGNPDQQRRLEKNYRQLAGREARNYPVSVLDNNGTIEEAIEQIFSLTKLGKPTWVRAVDSSLPVARETSTALKAPTIFKKLDPAKPSVVYDTYWRFASERQAIFFRRIKGELAPWSDDPIFREFKFTNAYRASDRTSQFLIRNVIYPGGKPFSERDPDEIFFRILLFKVFNRMATWQLLRKSFGEITFKDYSFERYDKVLTKAIDSGQRIYSAAYIMPSGGPSSKTGRKHRMHLMLIEQMIKDQVPSQLAQAPSMSKAFDILRSYPTIGDFLAYQFVTDLNYSSLINFSETSFVVPGPGARDGIRKCFTDFGGLNESDLIKVVADRQTVEFARLGLTFESLWGRPLQWIDCQNLFCEVDKYSRVKHPEISGLTGRLRIKQKYQVTAEPVDYWYPPKWELNEKIKEYVSHLQRTDRGFSLAADRNSL